MLQNKAEVHIYRGRDAGKLDQKPDQIIEFAFVSAARQYARDQIQAGIVTRAVVKDRDGTVIETFGD